MYNYGWIKAILFVWRVHIGSKWKYRVRHSTTYDTKNWPYGSFFIDKSLNYRDTQSLPRNKTVNFSSSWGFPKDVHLVTRMLKLQSSISHMLLYIHRLTQRQYTRFTLVHIMACTFSVRSQYLYQCVFIINLTIRDTLQRHLNQNATPYIWCN